MSKIYTSADQLIGKTPLLELAHIEKDLDLKAKILAKLEYFNPAGSVKDRIAMRLSLPWRVAPPAHLPAKVSSERWFWPGRWRRWPWLAMSWAPPRCCFWMT